MLFFRTVLKFKRAYEYTVPRNALEKQVSNTPKWNRINFHNNFTDSGAYVTTPAEDRPKP